MFRGVLSSSPNTLFAAALCIVFAVSLQIQITLFESENYIGLRLNLTDLLLPLVGGFILISLTFKHSLWPIWQKPFGLLWLIAPSAVLLFSLFYGHHISGDWSHWALINKGAGWLVLMAYFAAGAWITTNFSTRFLPVFLKTFTLSFVLISALYICVQIVLGYRLGYVPFDYLQLSGLMDNSNAYAFLLIAVTALISLQSTDNFLQKTLKAFWFFLPAFVLLNASRTLWIVMPPLILYLLFFACKRSWRMPVLLMAAGTIFTLTIVPQTVKDSIILRPVKTTKTLQVQSETTFEHLQELTTKQIKTGDNLRFAVLKSSLSAWSKNPIFGLGLGGGLNAQKETYGETLAVIDNTLLWILTDMGLIGALAFVGCFVAMLIALLKTIKNTQTEENRRTLAQSAFLILLAFAAFSLFHEILYTRFMWFILGLALATPAAALDQTQPPADQRTV